MPRITFDPDTSRGAGGNGEWGISEETIQDKPDTGKGMGRGKSTDSGTGAPAAQQPQRPEAADVVRGGLYADRTFTRLDGAVRDFVQAEFEHCTFTGCDFSYADLSHAFFSECLFRECRMVVPGLSAVHLRKAVFDGCLLSGLDFGQCVKAGFGVSFVRSRLDNCSFYELKMPGTRFDGMPVRGERPDRCFVRRMQTACNRIRPLPARKGRFPHGDGVRDRSGPQYVAAGEVFPLQPRGVACRVRD
mgnify:CR=1 FL=1